MEDKKWKLTKEELIKKINDERITFSRATEDMKQQRDRAITSIRRVTDLIIATIIKSYGTERDDEITLDIPIPRNPDGKFWAVKVEQPDKDTYRLVAKLFDVPAFEGRQTKINLPQSQQTKQEE